jgi:hypothetical protein
MPEELFQTGDYPKSETIVLTKEDPFRVTVSFRVTTSKYSPEQFTSGIDLQEFLRLWPEEPYSAPFSYTDLDFLEGDE